MTTPDGVPLAVREVGPTDAPLTVVFAHGFCLRMGAFHFQRMRLCDEWGTQVRMIFYDQRGHGRSGKAPPETFTLTQLGKDLETVLAVMAGVEADSWPSRRDQNGRPVYLLLAVSTASSASWKMWSP